ncbi:non-specific lipid-transfer protein A-like [Nymphaea colorata]|uniref:non-specific lipid-transfer protein A-like n=1 Tax=Nymphaea colorata TaxID=210225 RepID=UPI00214E3130|nr:non-specific lipid-transfer protein A-like [Nymphaea colorata]
MAKLCDLIKLVVVSAMIFLASARRSHSLDGAFECNSLYRMTECCLPYVTGIADRPSPECCNTVQRLKNMANKREEVVQYCQCFQAKALLLQHLNESTLRTLPNDCGYSFHSQVTLDCDCSMIA